jgi:hypothetical protein
MSQVLLPSLTASTGFLDLEGKNNYQEKEGKVDKT